MFLRCSYFVQNLSLDVLVNKVLKQNNACNVTWFGRLSNASLLLKLEFPTNLSKKTAFFSVSTRSNRTS